MLMRSRFVAANSRNIRRAKRWRPSLEYVYCCMVNRSLTIEMVLDKKKIKKKGKSK